MLAPFDVNVKRCKMKKGLYVVIVIVFIVCVVGSFAIGRASAPKPVNSEDNSSESGEMTVYERKRFFGKRGRNCPR